MTLEKLRCVVDWKKDKNKLKEFGAGPYFKNEATSGFEMANFKKLFRDALSKVNIFLTRSKLSLSALISFKVNLKPRLDEIKG